MKPEFFILGLLVAASPLYAIVDSQPNGMSDLWEKHYNSGVLFSLSNPNHAAGADPDGDGQTNEDEAVMGTDPFSTALPSGVVRVEIEKHPSVDGYFILSWPSTLGKFYEISISTDLASWAASGEVIAGTGNDIQLLIEAAYDDGVPVGAAFWRVEVSEDDPDNDGLTTWEENNLGTDPYHSDSDLDGILDGDDEFPLVNAAQADLDGANLPVSLTDNSLIGRWDFESGSTASGNEGYPSTPASTGACKGKLGAGWSPHHGIVSHGAAFPDNGLGYLSFPHSILQSRSTASFAFWIQLPKDQLSNLTGGKMELLGIGQGVVGSPFPIPELHAYLTSDGKLKMESDWVNFGSTSQLTSWSLPANFDDGEWHHLVIIKNGASYSGYVDGALIGSTSSNNFTFQFQYQPYFILGRRSTSGFTSAGLQGKIDRFRVYSKSLSSAEATALYEQDIDRDGLFDRNEGVTRLWRDDDSDAYRDYLNYTIDGSGSLVPSYDEISHIASPYLWDAADTDHDNDGLASAIEQNVGTDMADADTDDDRFPDGYEYANGMDPLSANGGYTSDSDGDGLTLEEELAYGTNPSVADTDGDLVNDGVEVNNGSLPNDGSDNGTAPDPADLYSVQLAIGDESGSDSENYHLIVYEYESATGFEKEVFRLESGGYGEYSGLKTVSGFRKDKDYTFQILWLGTNNNSQTSGGAEGPDFDYTMRVEPVTPPATLFTIDAINVQTGVYDSGYQLLGQKNDVHNFQYQSEAIRVLNANAYIDLAVDTNMDKEIDSLPDGSQAGSGWPESKTTDRDLDDEGRSVVIDVNNNNSDADDSGSVSNSTVDNANSVIDGTEDKEELINRMQGHSFGTLRIYAYPEKSFKDGKFDLRLSYVDPQDADVVRVFDWQDFSEDDMTPEVILGPGKTSTDMSSTGFFDQTFNPGKAVQFSYRDLVMEGITYGTVELRLELLDVTSTPPVVLATDEIKVTVNVDRFAQAPNQVSGNKDARHLRGEAPHHVGIRKSDVSYSGIRAIRGTVDLRVPVRKPSGTNPNGSKWSMLTPMTVNYLRRNADQTTKKNSGASFWIGLKELDGNGGLVRWVQGGVRWVQPRKYKIGSVPAMYLENGDMFQSLGAKNLNQAINGSGGDSALLGGGVGPQDVEMLSDWNTEPVRYSFVLFKEIKGTDATGADIGEVPWEFIVRDDNAQNITNGSFEILQVGQPKIPGSPTTQQSNDVLNRYKAEAYHDIDILFETNQSVTFAPGKQDQKASYRNVQFATSYLGNPDDPPVPTSIDGKKRLYEWAVASFSWEDLNFGANDLKKEIKTGRSLGNGAAEEGASDHPDWNAQVPAQGVLEIWDERNYGFGEIK